MWPVDGPVSQHFAESPASWQPDGHTGIDFAVPVGTPVRAVAAGTVLYEGWASGLGWPNEFYIAIDFDGPANGDQSAGIIMVIDHGAFVGIYGHLSQTGINRGDSVAMGEIIAQTGNTGNSSGPHLHFEILPNLWNVHGKFYGRVNPELYIGLAVILAANERLVAVGGARGRRDTAAGAELVRTVSAGAKEWFDAWRNGEVVNGNGVWYHDIDNLWYWSGNFEDHSTNGLNDLNPSAPANDVPPAPNERVTAAGGAQRRSAPDKNATAIGERFAATLRLTFRGYVRKTDPYGDGNNVWFVGAFGEPTYFHSSAFEDQGTHDLADLTADLFPETSAPPVVPPAVDVPYDFDLDFLTLNGIAVEKIPAHLTNIDAGNFPDKPVQSVCHWWNKLEVRPTIESVISEFTRKDAFKSAHWAVGETRIIQFVSLKDRAYHAGPGGNGWVGIEFDPIITEKDAAGLYTARALRVQANGRALLAALRDRKGYKFGTTLHALVPGAATSCSGIDLAALEIDTPPVVFDPAPTLPPTGAAAAQFTASEAAELANLARYLISSRK